MFTGIVEEAGVILGFEKGPGGRRLHVRGRKVLEDVRVGDSIAVNGCCLSVVAFDESGLRFDVLEETVRLTNFADLWPGRWVNLEKSLAYHGKIGGHLLTGHIDGTGTIEVLERRGPDYFLRVSIPEDQRKYVARKGCIALDGISLTVAELTENSLAVWLIPHTMEVTNLKDKKPGDLMNLEFDLLAKYLESLARGKDYALPA